MRRKKEKERAREREARERERERRKERLNLLPCALSNLSCSLSPKMPVKPEEPPECTLWPRHAVGDVFDVEVVEVVQVLGSELHVQGRGCFFLLRVLV